MAEIAQFIVNNIEAFQLIQVLNVPLTALASVVVIAAGIKFLVK